MEKKTFDERTEEFLGALKEGTEETYMPGLFQLQQYLISLPDPCWKDSDAPLQLLLDKVAEDQDLPARQRTRIGRTTIRGFIIYLKNAGFARKTVHSALPCPEIKSVSR